MQCLTRYDDLEGHDRVSDAHPAHPVLSWLKCGISDTPRDRRFLLRHNDEYDLRETPKYVGFICNRCDIKSNGFDQLSKSSRVANLKYHVSNVCTIFVSNLCYPLQFVLFPNFVHNLGIIQIPS